MCLTSADSSDDAYEYAVVPINLAEAMDMLKMMGIASIFKATDSTFYRACFLTGAADYYSAAIWPVNGADWGITTLELHELMARVDNHEWCILPQGYFTSVEASQPETESFSVGCDSVLFQCSPDNYGREIETEPLSQAFLASVTKELMLLDVAQKAQAAETLNGPFRRVIDLD